MTTRASGRDRSLLTVLVLLMALVASALAVAPAARAQQATPSPEPSASGGPHPAPVQVGNADSGRTVRLVPGQELQVELTAPQGEQWQGPASTGPLYLVEYREAADRTTARLEALRSQAEPVTLQARTDRPCFHSGEPCAQGFSEWTLQVVVDLGPAPDTSYPCHAVAPPPPGEGEVMVTQNDNGRRFTVEKGKAVRVYLSDCANPYVVPSAGGPLFRESASYGANGLNATIFRGLSAGTTRITSSTDPACFHTAPACASASTGFEVEVEVVPAVTDHGCTGLTAVELDRSTIVATGEAGMTVRATPGTVVNLFAYTRPATQYQLVRSAVAPGSGIVRFVIRPPRNTRLYAEQRGCAPAPPVVLNVQTALTLAAERTAPRTYRFSGDSLPARPGGLVVSLYRVTADGREVLTAQARADAATGQWQLVRRFTGTGRFGFVVRTGQDLQNAPGRSNVRSLLVY